MYNQFLQSSRFCEAKTGGKCLKANISLFLRFFSAKILHISKYPITFAPHLRKNNTLR